MTPHEEKVQLDLPSGWINLALIIGVVGLVGCAIAGFLNPDHEVFFRAYLVAFVPCLAICLGCLVLGMIGYLTTATWAAAFEPILESATKVLPLLALLFVPILVFVQHTYPWAEPGAQSDASTVMAHYESSPEHPANSAVLFARKLKYYLNPQFFIIRAVIYLAIWNIVALVVRRLARRAEATAASGSVSLTDSRRLRKFCGFGLVVYGATFTLAAVDWFMSLEPTWWSAMFPVIFAVGQFLTAYSFSVIVFITLVLRAPAKTGADGSTDKPSDHLSQQLLRDFGNLLLAFTMIWTYMNFCQYLLIYSGNLKEEAVWYMPRLHDGWQYLVLTIVATQFGIPFFLLLNKELKRNPRALRAVAILIFCSRFLDVTWQLVPSYKHDMTSFMWMLPLAFVGLGGLWAALFLYQLRRRVLVLKLAGLDSEAYAHE